MGSKKTILYHKADGKLQKVNELLNVDEVIQSNPNLLDNPDFKINQRGKIERSSSGYIVDRWKKTTQGVVIVETDGVLLDNTSGSSPMYFGQTLEMNLTGKTINISAYDSHGNLYSGSGTLSGANKDPITIYIGSIGRVYVDLNVTNYEFFFRIEAGESIKIKYAKLELGSVTTEFITPNPSVELLKCQRYYQKFGLIMAHIGSGFISGSTATKNAIIVCPAVQMRTHTPTVTIHGVLYINTYRHQGSSALPATELASDAGMSQKTLILPLLITTDDDLILGQGATLQIRDPDSYVEISADI